MTDVVPVEEMLAISTPAGAAHVPVTISAGHRLRPRPRPQAVSRNGMTDADRDRLSSAMHRREQAEDAKRRLFMPQRSSPPAQRPATPVVTTASLMTSRPGGPDRTGKKRNWLRRLPLSADHAAMIPAGVKTQVALRGVWTLPRPRPLLPVFVREAPHGPIGSDPIAQVKVLTRTHRALGTYTNADAHAEGMASLAAYKQAWARWCGPWDPQQVITVITFRYVPPEEVLARHAADTQESGR
jgi:hypothetical protein